MNNKYPTLPLWAHPVVESLLETLKKRDLYTYQHCQRVAKSAKILAKKAGLNKKEQKIVELSGLFHDLGKIGIPDSILLKTSSLTQNEENIMKTHPIKSVEIIQPLMLIPFFKSMEAGILHHHERVDGQGYPHGLSGDKINIYAKIISIVDTFDAITSTRPYRKELSKEYAYQELKFFSGKQFDTRLVKIFLKTYPSWKTIEEEELEAA